MTRAHTLGRPADARRHRPREPPDPDPRPGSPFPRTGSPLARPVRPDPRLRSTAPASLQTPTRARDRRSRGDHAP